MERIAAIRKLLEDAELVAAIESMQQGEVVIGIGSSQVDVLVSPKIRRRIRDVERVQRPLDPEAVIHV